MRRWHPWASALARTLDRLSGLSGSAVVRTATRTLRTPAHVPDTEEFWARCVEKALSLDTSREHTRAQLSRGKLDLLSLPEYGRYQHTYEELLARQYALIASAGDRVTVLHLGRDLDDEVTDLYLSLAGSTTPLGEDDLADLRVLAERCLSGPQPESIPVRENRAVLNEARLAVGAELLLDTVVDVLQLACALSGGDADRPGSAAFRVPSAAGCSRASTRWSRRTPPS